jgi:hypothetical protein
MSEQMLDVALAAGKQVEGYRGLVGSDDRKDGCRENQHHRSRGLFWKSCIGASEEFLRNNSM